MLRDEILRIIKRNLEGDELEIEQEKNVYKDFKADLLIREKNVCTLVLVKLSRDDILTTLTNSRTYSSLPEITRIYIASPSELLQADIVRIAEYLGFGLYGIKEDELEEVRTSKTFPGASLSGGGSYPSSVLPGQTFEVNVDLSAGEKIVPNIEVSCIVGKPFSIAEGEHASKKIEELKPGESVRLSFRVKIDNNTQLGKYPIFVSRRGDNVPFYVDLFQIRVKEEDEDTIKQAVQNAVAELNFATSTNIERILSQIEEAVLRGAIDIKENIFDKSVWNDIGAFCLSNGLYKPAELVYYRMLETIQKQENRSGIRLHKGMALHNLGIALYFQGRVDEAKKRFSEAFEEDKKTYGETKAKEMLAKKTISELLREQQ